MYKKSIHILNDKEYMKQTQLSHPAHIITYILIFFFSPKSKTILQKSNPTLTVSKKDSLPSCAALVRKLMMDYI